MDTIFKNFIYRTDGESQDLRKGYALWFIDTIPESEFTGDDLIFWKYLEYSCKLNINVCYDYFSIWLSTDLRKVLKKTGAKVAGCEALNYSNPQAFETAVYTTKKVMCDNFRVLESMESNLDDFIVEMGAFLDAKLKARVTEILSKTYDTQSRTDDVMAASEYALQSLQMVTDIYSSERLEDLGTRKDSGVKPRFVTDCGIPLIDNDSKGLWTKQVFDIEAQSGAGKTRFVIGTYVYRCAVVHKNNVLYISMEQEVDEIEAMLVALHTFNMFNIQIESTLIHKDLVPDEYKSSVEAARIDLFESGNYGTIELKFEVLKRETFRQRLDTLDKLKGPFDLIAIDYLGLFEQDSSARVIFDKYVIISDSLKFFKRWCTVRNKAGITLSQFNRDGVSAGAADKAITTEHAEGGIAVFRHCDYNIAISFTEDMKAKNKRRFQLPKVRSSRGFPRFLCDVRLAFCYWKQDKSVKEV